MREVDDAERKPRFLLNWGSGIPFLTSVMFFFVSGLWEHNKVRHLFPRSKEREKEIGREPSPPVVFLLMLLLLSVCFLSTVVVVVVVYIVHLFCWMSE